MKKMIICLLFFYANFAKASEQEAPASKILLENPQRESFDNPDEIDEEIADLEEELESIPVNKKGEEYLYMIMNLTMPPPPPMDKEARNYIKTVQPLERKIEHLKEGNPKKRKKQNDPCHIFYEKFHDLVLFLAMF